MLRASSVEVALTLFVCIVSDVEFGSVVVEGPRPGTGLSNGSAAAQLDKKSQGVFLGSDSARLTTQNHWISQNAALLASGPRLLLSLAAEGRTS